MSRVWDHLRPDEARHAWTKGLVERLQGTILDEHWRAAFRGRYFTRAHQLQVPMDGSLLL